MPAVDAHGTVGIGTGAGVRMSRADRVVAGGSPDRSYTPPMHADLQSFVATLRQTGDLVEIETPCDPVLEIPEIHRRVIAAGGPALLFR